MQDTQETTALVQIVETSGLEKSKGIAITETLSKFFEKAGEWNQTIESIVITDPSEVGKMKMAKEGRLYLKNLRLEGEKIVDAKRKEIKARMADDVLEDKLWLKAGQMMEATFKNLESKLEDKEKFAERWEAERKTKLREERISILAEYKEFVPFGIENSLGEMEASEFDKLLNGAKLQMQAKIEAEKKAEEERILFEKKQAEEREAQRLENERLKKEAEENKKREDEKKILRAKRSEELKPYIVFIRDYSSLIEKEEPEYQKEFSEIKKGAELQWEYDRKEMARIAKEKEEQDAKFRKEREERERVEAELKAKQEAEEKAKLEAEAKKEAELSMGDKEKFMGFLSDLEMLKYKHQFKSKKYQKIQTSINDLLEKTIVYGKTKIQ